MKKFTVRMFFLSCFLLIGSNIWAQRFAPTVDTYIDQLAAQADLVQNTTNPHKLVVRKYTNQERIAFLEFNIGDYNKKVAKAEFCLYMFNASAINKSEEVEVYEVTSGNISNDVTWNNFNGNYTLSENPITSLTITTGDPASTANGWYRFDVTSLINTVVNKAGNDKKVSFALKAKTTGLLLNFYSADANSGANNYPYYSPFLICTPEISSILTEKSREVVEQDGFVYNINADAGTNYQYLWVNYYKSGEAIQQRITNLRFNIPNVALTEAHTVAIKTKIYKDQSGEKPVYVIDLLGMPNIDASGSVNVDNLTWNTMPANTTDYVYLRSYFSSVEDRNNETDVIWDVTEYVKSQQVLGKISVVFSLQVPETGLGGVGGHNLAFYARNFMNAEPGTTNVPQIILYEDESFVSIGETEGGQDAQLIIDENILSLSNGETMSASVYTIQGAILESINDANTLDVTSYAQGVYFLKLKNGATYKFMKK